MLSEGTILLLGLERDIWENTPDDEKARYKRVGASFFALNAITLVSSTFLMHLLGFGWMLAAVVGAISAFILMSIVRFSLIIYRRSVFEYEKEREKLDAKLTSGSKNEVSPDSSATTLKLNSQAVKNTVLAPIRTISEYIKSGTAHSKIPGLGGFIRTGILMMVAFLIIFPLAALLDRSFVEKINESRRSEYIVNFQQEESIRLNKLTAELENEIEQITVRGKTGRENNSAANLAENQEQINKLRNKIETLRLNSERDQQLFLHKLTDRYFLVFTLSAVRKTAGFYVSLIIVLLLFILPHWILYRIKVDPSGYYAERAVKRYRSIIDEAYQKTEAEGYGFLDNKFQYLPESFKENIFWKNPPYNSIPRVHFSKKVRVSKAEFLKMEGNQ
jgi:ABC-type multidrug transport system fused ATPase/permease subunit